jgi:hypothetical protein
MTTADTTTADADTATLDSPTVWAAVVTLLFAVLAAAALSSVPMEGSLAGALDAVKNIVYVLTVPLFDLARRFFSRRKLGGALAAASAEAPNLLWLAFATALVLFVLVELISWLTGFGMGGTCVTLGFTAESGQFGNCLTIGIQILGTVIIGPIMLALGASAGWIWRGTLHSGFLTALLIFMVAVALLFALDFFILLQQAAGPAQALQDHFNAFGPVRQIGLQVAILSIALLAGYGARRIWQRVARAIG